MNRQEFRARFREDLHDCPATMALGASWLVVFVWMVADQAARGQVSPDQLLGGLRNGHWFGDFTLQELHAGQVWRTLTATFVHFGLLHIAMNLYALYQLGGLVESWYGSGPFVAIYVLTGAGGNLLSAAIRWQLHANPAIEAGGGSTVIMGLVALCAVAAWRSRTRLLAHLRNLMLYMLIFTFSIGFGLTFSRWPVIDNWGHVGGAVVGALIGFADAALLRQFGARLGRLAGWSAATLIIASALALVADDRKEPARREAAAQVRQRRFRDEYLIQQLDKIRTTYRAVAFPRGLRRGQFVPILNPAQLAALAPAAAPKAPSTAASAKQRTPARRATERSTASIRRSSSTSTC